MQTLIGLDLGGMAQRFAEAARTLDGMPTRPESAGVVADAVQACVAAAKAMADAATKVLGTDA